MSSKPPPADRYPSQPPHLTALDLPVPSRGVAAADLQKYFGICDEKIGFLPNVLAAYSWNEKKLRAFSGFYNDLMLDESPLSKLEREMIAVVVSSANAAITARWRTTGGASNCPATRRSARCWS